MLIIYPAGPCLVYEMKIDHSRVLEHIRAKEGWDRLSFGILKMSAIYRIIHRRSCT